MRRLLPFVFFLAACGDDAPDAPSIYASEVVDFQPGDGAGYGADDVSGRVLGPASGRGLAAGSVEVLSLGEGGEITLAFDRSIVNEPGVDFIVFENAFWPDNDASSVFAELAEVGVSEDGDAWHWFACDTVPVEAGVWPGCAGWRPTLEFDTSLPLDPKTAGGDAFDLEDLGLEEVRFVRIRDVQGNYIAPTGGFDLDAVGIVHLGD